MQIASEHHDRTAILVVSFGTTHTETYQKTIAVIEKEIQNHYPNYPLYSAWTSSVIRKIVKSRDQKHIFSVTEALEQMYKDGMTHIIVQPTHIIDGIENTAMKNDIEKLSSYFTHISIGEPLLASTQSIQTIANILIHQWNLKDDELLVYIGHGSKCETTVVYNQINHKLREKNCTNIIIGTMQSNPSIKDIIEYLNCTAIRKIILVPFMIVAGSHAHKEIAGNEETSWKSIFESHGYHVNCILKGLGEIADIREIFIHHIEQSMQQ